MFDLIIHNLSTMIASIPFSGATWFVLFVLGFFVWIFVRANKNPDSPIVWEHLIIESTTDRTSPYKVGYLVGLIVATWVVVSITDRNNLTLDIFGVYLTYLLGGVGTNIYAKKDVINTKPPTE
jgi:hypothetical protein